MPSSGSLFFFSLSVSWKTLDQIAFSFSSFGLSERSAACLPIFLLAKAVTCRARLFSSLPLQT